MESNLLLQVRHSSEALVERGCLQLRGETNTVVGEQPLGEDRGIAMLYDPVLELLEIDAFALGKQGDALEGRQIDVAHIVRLDDEGAGIVAVEVPQESGWNTTGYYSYTLYLMAYSLGFLPLGAPCDEDQAAEQVIEGDAALGATTGGI